MLKARSIFNDPKLSLKAKNEFSGSTAWKIFDRENQYPFKVNQAHFRVVTGRHNVPLYGSSMKEQRYQENLLIDTRGTIIDMSDYFKNGATLSITSGQVAKEVYQAILRHLEAHLTALQTNIHYEPPEDDTLKELAEFATAIHYKALEVDPNVDQSQTASAGLSRLMSSRAFISLDISQSSVKPEVAVPKSVTKMDAIERFLETYRN